jgi:hypothetical protein
MRGEMGNKKILSAASTVLLMASLLLTSVPVMANPSGNGYILDQEQEGTNYGFLFDNSAVRWQEFKPTQTSLAKIDLYIRKDGEPGNLLAVVRDGAGDTLWGAAVAGVDIEARGWVEIPIVPSISVEPNSSYYIYVSSDALASEGNKYFWLGQTDSGYDRGISSVEGDWPGYDFAFRT